MWSNDVGEQAQSACFSPDGEVIVVGTVTGKWVVLSAATREVFSVNQVRDRDIETGCNDVMTSGEWGRGSRVLLQILSRRDHTGPRQQGQCHLHLPGELIII